MKEELHVIIIKSEQFLENVYVLMREERYEGAINRAYYATFTALRAILFSRSIFAKTHSGVHTKE